MENKEGVDHKSNCQSAGASGYVAMPRELTTENGAKALLIGNFCEYLFIDNPDYCGCGDCIDCQEGTGMMEGIDQRVDISWSTIKAIYKKAVEHLGT